MSAIPLTITLPGPLHKVVHCFKVMAPLGETIVYDEKAN